MANLKWLGKKAVQNHYSKIPFHTLDLLYTYPSTSQASKLDSSIAREALGLAKNCAKTSLDGYPTSNFKDSQEICHENLAENKIIKGDNLLALKSLLPMYANKIHCIYIDPPYNTGSENWIYNDNVNSPLMQKWLSKVVGKEDLTRHDKWLCMMYPRLRLLHELLSENGVIFISIDDNEMAHLKLLCDEIFGERNFVANLIWRKIEENASTGGTMKITKRFRQDHEYIVCYAKEKNLFLTNKYLELPNFENEYKNLDNDPRGAFKAGSISMKGNKNSNKYYKITTPSGKEYERVWRITQDEFQKLHNDNRIYYGKKGDSVPQIKIFINEERPVTPKTLFENLGSAFTASDTLKDMFQTEQNIFDNPKPTDLIKRILEIATKKDSIILDSFAGSGTTAHAVLELNKQDGGNRKFILIECEDYADSITAQRVKYAISGYGKEPMLNATGGEFSFLEVGEPVLLNKKGKKVLNENLKIQKILEYIFYTEFDTALTYNAKAFSANYFVGEVSQKALYFIYEKHKATTLNLEFLPRLKQQDSYIIYADNCALSPEQLKEQNIEFRQIPRDIKEL